MRRILGLNLIFLLGGMLLFAFPTLAKEVERERLIRFSLYRDPFSPHTQRSVSSKSPSFTLRKVVTPQKSLTRYPIASSSSWNGHFSAEYFGVQHQQKLSHIKKVLQKTLQQIPSSHKKALSTLVVRNKTHPSRGLANGHKIILHTASIAHEKELQAVFIHELGHVTDLGALKGSAFAISKNFKDGKTPIAIDDPSLDFYRISWEREKRRKPQSTEKDFVSGYAMTSCFEDFAESYLFYRLHGEKFREKAKYSQALQKKYQFLKERVFGGKEFQLEKKPPQRLSYIWDATKLDF